MPDPIANHDGLADYGVLLNPQKEPPLWVTKVVDKLSWASPVIAAVLSIGSGIEALWQMDRSAAMLAIVAAVFGAAGVWFTNCASRIRDRRLSRALALAALGTDMADHALRSSPPWF
ncbi:MAG: hypothetical protein ACREE4_03230 [Stellaceae bacterium]